jgi:hypothetical protein
MPLVGFEIMIPVFKRAKTVHALDGAATMKSDTLSGQNQIACYRLKYGEILQIRSYSRLS